jgi:hypothetical protein
MQLPQIRPLHLLAVAAAGLLLVFAATVPIVDIDLWWHRWLGDEILLSGTIAGIGTAWAPFGDPKWTTTQWLSEVIFALLHSAGGYGAVTALRLVVICLICAVLARTCLLHRSPFVASPVYAATLLGLALFVVQDRPQTLALVAAAALGGWVDVALRGRPLPRIWVVPLVTWLWANIHGSWVLAPTALAVLAVGLLLDADRVAARQALARSAAAVCAGLVTPAGLDSAVAIVRFAGRTRFLGEWGPVQLAQTYGLPLAALIGALVVAWARQRSTARAELLVGLTFIAFSLTANRNIPFGLVLLAPLVVTAWSRGVGAREDVVSRGSTLATAAAGVSLASAVALAAIVHAQIEPEGRAEPRRIGAYLGQQADPVRVLNTYESAGVLLDSSEGNVELAIDGRADRYSPDYVQRYFDAVDRVRGVEALLSEVEPDVAVLEADEALTSYLSDRGWHEIMVDGDHVLLAPPDWQRQS